MLTAVRQAKLTMTSPGVPMFGVTVQPLSSVPDVTTAVAVTMVESYEKAIAPASRSVTLPMVTLIGDDAPGPVMVAALGSETLTDWATAGPARNKAAKMPNAD